MFVKFVLFKTMLEESVLTTCGAALARMILSIEVVMILICESSEVINEVLIC